MITTDNMNVFKELILNKESKIFKKYILYDSFIQRYVKVIYGNSS